MSQTEQQIAIPPHIKQAMIRKGKLMDEYLSLITTNEFKTNPIPPHILIYTSNRHLIQIHEIFINNGCKF